MENLSIVSVLLYVEQKLGSSEEHRIGMFLYSLPEPIFLESLFTTTKMITKT